MKEKLKEGIRLIQKNLTSVYLWFMLVIFPVYLRDKLFDTTDAKYLLLIHLGYLAYDQKTQMAYIPNEEIIQEFVTATKRKKWNELQKFQICSI